MREFFQKTYYVVLLRQNAVTKKLQCKEKYGTLFKTSLRRKKYVKMYFAFIGSDVDIGNADIRFFKLCNEGRK